MTSLSTFRPIRAARTPEARGLFVASDPLGTSTTRLTLVRRRALAREHLLRVDSQAIGCGVYKFGYSIGVGHHGDVA